MHFWSDLRSRQTKEALIKQIDSILQSDVLDPCTVGKLQGQPRFGASQALGKVFPRALSEKQYLNRARRLQSLQREWRMLVIFGLPSPIEPRLFCKADVINFTEGFAADPRKREGWTGSAEGL